MQRIFVLGGICLGGLIGSMGDGQAQPVPSVTVAAVEAQTISDRIEALGTLRASESVEITATVSERVVEVGFEDGDRVQKGQVLLKLFSDEAQALLKEARATASEASKQYDRIRQLTERGAASLAQMDESRRVYETAQARVVALESRLSNLILTAPFDGVVGLRDISVGALVRPGDLVTTLDDDRVMLLDFSVPSTFLTVVAPGLPITATAKGLDGEVFHGVVRSVSSRVDPVTRSVQVRAEVPNPERKLKPGLLLAVELEANPREALLVPESALLPMGRGNAVFVVQAGADGGPTVARRTVQIGRREKGRVEILQGLKPGDTVVSHGGFLLSEGAKVRVTEPVVGKKTTGS